jgi:hypothetical protein
MEFVLILIVVMLLLSVVLGPLVGPEDRPAFLKPDEKPRPMVGPPW